MLAGARRPCLRLHNFRRIRLFHAQRIFNEDPRWPGWEVVVGIEVHAQMKTRNKLFSGRRTTQLVTRGMPFNILTPRILDIRTWTRSKHSCVFV